jgi:hypothetical protein
MLQVRVVDECGAVVEPLFNLFKLTLIGCAGLKGVLLELLSIALEVWNDALRWDALLVAVALVAKLGPVTQENDARPVVARALVSFSSD